MSESESDADKTPIPVRYRWLKRIIAGCLVLLVAVVALRLWWGRVADRRLQAEIDRIIAAGEPLFPEDFNSPRIADDQNAVPLLSRAAASLANSGAATIEPLVARDPGPAYWAGAEAVIKANANTLTLVRRARSMPIADWDFQVTSPVMNTLFPPLSSHRELARFVCGTARYQHHLARDDEAVESVRDARAIGAVVGKHPTLIAYLVARAMKSVVGVTIETMAPDLRIVSTATAAPEGGTPASRDRIQDLITDLLDDGPSRESLVRAMYIERMSHLDTTKLIAEDPSSLARLAAGGPANRPRSATGILAWPVKPLFLLDAVHMLQRGTRIVEGARQSSWPAARDRLPAEPIDQSGLRAITHVLSRTITASLTRVQQLHFEGLAVDRMAAIALAMRMYELDHGRRPRTLNVLVPDYLARVPDDPFDANGRPIAYRPDADPPVLYSIGLDGKDDRGTFVFSNGRIDTTTKDIPFFLNGDRP